eukprot:TRINITY_DN5280_c0_g1_i1.p1 TRINITY_DN5280_c0_g1~~TRINITY_DN5280_c0_g1_i1.p1  ORF type:complete len:172 (-),score=37.57 TRINITY_DN5280_c0_g1_i1:21-536(-)
MMGMVMDERTERLRDLDFLKLAYQERVKEALLAKSTLFEVQKQLAVEVRRADFLEKDLERSIISSQVVLSTFSEVIQRLKEHEKQKTIRELVEELEEYQSRGQFETKHTPEAKKYLQDAKQLFSQAQQLMKECEGSLSSLNLQGLSAELAVCRASLAELTSTSVPSPSEKQ